MSGGRRSCFQTNVTQDPGLPFGYVSSSERDGIFNHLDYCIYIYIYVTPLSNNVTYEVFMASIIVLDSLLMGSSFIKLMLTLWISIHLFALAVFHKNLQRLERLYVVSSLLIPLAVTIVLLGINLTGCHGNSTYRWEEIIFIIIFAVLVIVSLLMVVMGTILCHRACRRRNAVLSEYDAQHKKALREMLPLLLHPLFFLLFTMPIFGFAVYDFVTPEYNVTYLHYNTTITVTEYNLEAPLLFALFAPFWSFTTSLLLISHLYVVRCISKKRFYNLEIGKTTQKKDRLLSMRPLYYVKKVILTFQLPLKTKNVCRAIARAILGRRLPNKVCVDVNNISVM